MQQVSCDTWKCFVYPVPWSVTHETQFKNAVENQQGIFKQNAWLGVFGFILLPVEQNTVQHQRALSQTKLHIIVVMEVLRKLILTTFQEKQKTIVVVFQMKIVSILIIYTNYDLRLIRWEWVLCFYYIFC